MIDLTQLAQAIISVVALLITTFVIPWIKAKVSDAKMQEIYKWVKIAVSAAEMIYKEAGMGEAKKAYVNSFLKVKGYSLNVDEVDAMIESAVHDMKIFEVNE